MFYFLYLFLVLINKILKYHSFWIQLLVCTTFGTSNIFTGCCGTFKFWCYFTFGRQLTILRNSIPCKMSWFDSKIGHKMWRMIKQNESDLSNIDFKIETLGHTMEIKTEFIFFVFRLIFCLIASQIIIIRIAVHLQ